MVDNPGSYRVKSPARKQRGREFKHIFYSIPKPPSLYLIKSIKISQNISHFWHTVLTLKIFTVGPIDLAGSQKVNFQIYLRTICFCSSSFLRLLHFWSPCHFLGCLKFLGCLHIWGHPIFWGHLHFWGCLHFCCLLHLGAIFILGLPSFLVWVCLHVWDRPHFRVI